MVRLHHARSASHGNGRRAELLDQPGAAAIIVPNPAELVWPMHARPTTSPSIKESRHGPIEDQARPYPRHGHEVP